MSLQYPNTEFILQSIKNVTGLNIENYKDKILFFQLDVDIENIVDKNNNIISANLVKPDVWDLCIEIAKKKLSNKGPGILIFASALNLLFFSPTFGSSILQKIKKQINEDKSLTYIFSVSTTAKKEEIAILESTADNLFVSRSEKHALKIFLKILRVKYVKYIDKEIQIPIKPETLNHIKEIANHSRCKVIPKISKI